ncbi:GTP cyclohydrolase II [Arthrobacter subterraneus]|uniref:GTP cyclohydrolase-2 n=1 Tax=Arthrobacter subterraneus TaxID=335973 RepID=A0A1G8EEC3_9MICC|nr:GTP cyclohydrolase II [Arthrobacter subterraneus]SDH68215.1 GTP cyclohydrolase II [Arthrobacter subterraneus]
MSAVVGGPVVSIPTAFGSFRAQAWVDTASGVEHLTMSSPGTNVADGAPLVRMHSECLTGDVFGSYRCDCGEQLEQALGLIQEQGGTVVYLRGQEGRGIGLANKLRAYALQENGADTVEANEQLGLPVDARDYQAAAEILTHLGITTVRLLSNNPVKREHLERYGIAVESMVPSEIPSRLENQHYLETKRDRLNHQLSHLEERFHQRPQEKIVQQS